MEKPKGLKEIVNHLYPDVEFGRGNVISIHESTGLEFYEIDSLVEFLCENEYVEDHNDKLRLSEKGKNLHADFCSDPLLFRQN